MYLFISCSVHLALFTQVCFTPINTNAKQNFKEQKYKNKRRVEMEYTVDVSSSPH